MTREKEKFIIESIRSGNNSSALSLLYQESLKKVRNYIIKNSGTREEADDIFQESVIILVFRIRKALFDENQSIDGFLYTVARNLWINRVKKIQRHKHYEAYVLKNGVEDSIPDPLAHIIDRERATTMEKVFMKLEENCRRILKYAVFEKLSMKEISLKMGHKNEHVSKAQHYRCKQYLARLVREHKEAIELS